MSFVMTYEDRNLRNLAQLGDRTKALAVKFYNYCIQNEIDILIYETIRTKEQQRANIASGASQTMRSYHIVGQALDFVPVNGKNTLWNGYGNAKVKKAIAYAKSLGMEWGGDWKNFIDKPHLEYNKIGYGRDTFRTKGQLVGDTTTNYAPSPSLPSNFLEKGASGTLVKGLQYKLQYLGFAIGKYGVDGEFGASTEEAVKAFQKKYNLSADGIAGTHTLAKLEEVYKEATKPKPEPKPKEEEKELLKMKEKMGEYRYEQFVKILEKARDKGVITSDEWITKAKNDNLTIEEAVYLEAIFIERLLLDK